MPQKRDNALALVSPLSRTSDPAIPTPHASQSRLTTSLRSGGLAPERRWIAAAFDLDQWNPEFFDRLHRFLSMASGYGIIVEVVMLSNAYEDSVWALNPLNARKHVNGLEEVAWMECMTMRHARLFNRQAAPCAEDRSGDKRV